MPRESAQSRVDRNTYIPPHIEQAMNQHMQHSMPAHLKKYVGSGSAYVPQSAQAAISREMQKSMPAHLKQYAGAYMQQRVVQPNTARLGGLAQGPRQVTPQAPIPDRLRLDHSNVNAGQYEARFHNNLFASDTPPATGQPVQPGGGYAPGPQAPQPSAQVPQPNPSPYHQDYDFIMNSGQQPKPSFTLPGGNSVITRIALFGGGLLVLLIIGLFVKGLFGGESVVPAYVSIAQQQQEIIHLSANAQQQEDLSGINKNFAATAELSLGTSQSRLIEYLAKNGKKLGAKQLNLKISSDVDARLTTAAEAATYNETFKEIMQGQLNEYMSTLQGTFSESKSEQGRALLDNNYKQAQLLLEQLNTSASSVN